MAKLVVVINTCFDCDKRFVQPQKLRIHLKNQHLITIPERKKARRHNNYSFTYVKTTTSHESVEEQFGCPACLEHFAMKHELKRHYYSDHAETLPATESRPQCLNSGSERSVVYKQEKEATSGDSESEKQQKVTIKDDVRIQQLEQNGKQIKRRTTSIDSIENELLNPSSISFLPPDPQNCFKIQSLDVNIAFYNFQQSILNNKWKLTLEDHMHSAMALHSILFLSPEQHIYNDISPFFDQTMYTTIINTIEGKYGFKRPLFPMDTITKILNIIQDVLRKSISRDKSIVLLLSLDIPAQEIRFVKMIVQLMNKLPWNPISDNTNESELGTRYIDPFLCGLFDDPDQGMYLRWTNEITMEARKNDDLANKSRPDICITSLCGSRFSTSHGFGEVKSAAHDSNHFLLCKDLLRVATFCKDALDTQNMKAVLGIQVVGRTICFYILLLPAKGLYIFLELGKINIPSSLQDLTKLVMDAPLLLLIIDAFGRLCVPSTGVSSPDRHRPTISKSRFNQIFSLSQNRKRLCPLQRN
ncbi:hypothetical protein BDB01DRAFT_778454 [Pilobolus umbonatus]|nr:hypothetical protein BDB01DRAFT_778454 [Pilobolus umbonatus]